MSEKMQVSTVPSPRKKKNLLPAEVDAQLQSMDRRRFLSKGMAMAGTTLAAGAVGVTAAGAAPLPVPESNKSMGKPIPVKPNQRRASRRRLARPTSSVST